MSERELTEKQKLFLAYLFHDSVMGDFDKAKVAAGYSENTSSTAILESLKDEVQEHTRMFLARNAPKAAFGVVGLIDRPDVMGAKIKLAAAAQVLDRVGIVKTEKVEVTGGAFILPPKDS